jgi:hypothetical protein
MRLSLGGVSVNRQGCFLVLGLCLLLLTSVFASGQTIYTNGPINGDSDGWTINESFVVSDSFTVSQGSSQINGVVFGAWLVPGDLLESVEVAITSSEFGGTVYFDQQVPFTVTPAGCYSNDYGLNVCAEGGSFNGPTLGNGTYWINFSNAVVNDGDPVYWDENSGPSQASESSIGSIPSESFTLLGSSTSTTGTVPEPSSLMLLMAGAISIAGVVRRKLG